MVLKISLRIAYDIKQNCEISVFICIETKKTNQENSKLTVTFTVKYLPEIFVEVTVEDDGSSVIFMYVMLNFYTKLPLYI